LTLAPLSAQRPPSDTVAGASGDIIVIPIMHGTVELVAGAHVVLVDPGRSFLDPPVRPPGPITRKLYAGLKPPTLILVTDIHDDHFDPDVITIVKGPATVVVGPPAVSGKLAGAGKLANGQLKTVDGVLLEAVPMYNLSIEKGEVEPFHRKGRGNGYIVTLGGKRFFFAGDTSCTPEIKALKNIDVAFLPMNLPYTMSSADAVRCASAFKPKIVYPYHYIGHETTTGPPAFEKALSGSGIEVRRRDWYVGVPPPR
jgi:L-ascorbate metabolism protein UlaG (beta-lactamase superfamily)